MVKRLLVRAVSWPGLLILATASVYVWQAWDPGGWYLPTAKTALVLLQWVHEWTVAFAQQFLPEYMSNFIKNNPPDMHRAHGYLIVFLMFVFAAMLGMVLWVLGKAFSFLTGGLPRTSPQSQPTQPSPPQNQGPSKRRGMKVFLWVGALLLGIWAFTGGAVASGHSAVSKYVSSTLGWRNVMKMPVWGWVGIALVAVWLVFGDLKQRSVAFLTANPTTITGAGSESGNLLGNPNKAVRSRNTSVAGQAPQGWHVRNLDNQCPEGTRPQINLQRCKPLQGGGQRCQLDCL